jgi:hypothetical protein
MLAESMDEHADFLAKLRQIEDAAVVAGSDLPDGGSAKQHFRHIALLARTLRSRLEMGFAIVTPTAPNPLAGPDDQKPSV